MTGCMAAPAPEEEPGEQQRGHDDQAAFLRGKTLAEARHCLAARLATLEGNAYNQGGNRATRRYIGERLARQARRDHARAHDRPDYSRAVADQQERA